MPTSFWVVGVKEVEKSGVRKGGRSCHASEASNHMRDFFDGTSLCTVFGRQESRHVKKTLEVSRNQILPHGTSAGSLKLC
jgi:hypothetical protein